MKRAGLSLITVSLLLISIVIFQNCGGFVSVRGVASQASSVTRCPVGYNEINDVCVLISSGCTAGAMQACTIANGTGAETCSSSNVWSDCVATSCNSGYTLTKGSCVSSTGSVVLACNGTFTLAIAGLTTVSGVQFTENSAGTVNITYNGTTLGSGNCSTAGSPGTASYSFTFGSVTYNCAGSYTIASSKTTITATCLPGSLSVTATQQ